MIDTTIPLASFPSPSRRKYDWDNMTLGVDSFFIACADAREILSKRQSLYSSAIKAGVKVSTRRVDGGLRVWRVE